MSFLNTLKQKSRESSIVPHPLREEDSLVRQSYLTLQALLAQHGDGALHEAEKTLLEDLALALSLPVEQVAKTLEIVAGADGDLMDALADHLTDSKVKLYMFIDLWRMAWRDGDLHANEAEMIAAFGPIFKMDDEVMAFVAEFGKAFAPGASADALTQLESVPETYSKEVLYYFFPKLRPERLDGRVLEVGEVLELKKSYELYGVLEVPAGAKLVLDGANITFANIEAGIICNAGDFKILNTCININNTMGSTAIQCINVIDLKINNSTFLGSRKSALLSVTEKSGSCQIDISNSIFKSFLSIETLASVLFVGEHIEYSINNCQFIDCGGNSVVYIYESKSEQEYINFCQFNSCKTKDSIVFNRAGYVSGYKTKIYNCIFRDCSTSTSLTSSRCEHISNFAYNCVGSSFGMHDDQEKWLELYTEAYPNTPLADI